WPWVLGSLAWLVLVAGFCAGMYIGRFVDRRLAAAIAAAARDEPHWRINDLVAHREPVPDDQNSALVVAEVVALLPKGWPGPSPPAPGQPLPAKTKAQHTLEQGADAPENLRLDADTADVFREQLREHEEALGLARTVTNYARGRHEIVLGPEIYDTSLAET